jgi:hypothetical protein
MIRLEQRGAVAFTLVGAAVVVILLITPVGISVLDARLPGCSTSPSSLA